MQYSTLLTLFGAMCLTIVAFGSRADAQEDASVVQELLVTNCVGCHGMKKSEGDLRLDSLATDHWDDYNLLDELFSRIADGEMPPSDAPSKLSQEEKEKLSTHLQTRLNSLESARLAGKYKKLTAIEYSNSLADIFGEPINATQRLPFDSDKDLKKLGEHQVVTSYAVQKYYDAAQRYLDRLILHDPIVEKTTTYTSAAGDLLGRRYTTTAGALAGGGNEPIFIVRNPVKTFVEEGEYEVMLNWHCFYVPNGEKLDLSKTYKSVPPIQAPTIKYFLSREGQVLNPLLEYKSDRQVLCDMSKPIRIVLDKDNKFLSFRGPGNQFREPATKDPRFEEIRNSDLDKNAKRNATKSLQAEIMGRLHGDKIMRLLVTGATFRGPLNKAEPLAHARVFGELKRSDGFAKCEPIIERLAEALFRRPVADEVLTKYVALGRREYSASRNAYLAIKVAVNAMLCSPHFVFKYEGNQPQLDDYMIAARLSYFLWNGPPDEELLGLAARGELQSPTVRREQGRRLLANRQKANRFTRSFTRQWLALDKFGDYTPNEAYMPTATFANLRPHMAREPQEFFNEILYQNLSALNFIDSDFVVWNRPLQGHYQAKDLKYSYDRNAPSEEFQRVELTQNPHRARGGLPTMAAIMSLTTDGENTQPILRGVWLARRMLGTEIEAPATVPAIEINLENVSKPREVLAKHKADRSCYACHVKFDYLGLAMENFDVLGRWKTDYVHPVLNDKNRFELVKKDPIDSISETPAGAPMAGVSGLKDHLMDRKEVVMRHLIETLFQYALGREIRYKDREQIGDLLESTSANDYKLRDLILELVACKSFAMR